MGDKKGSNLLEYIIPLAVIAIVVGGSIYYMSASGLLNKFLFNSSGAKFDKNTGKLVIGDNTYTMGGEKVTYNADGSISFQVDGQKVNLQPQFLNYADEAAETSGTNGSSDIIKEIAYLIRQNKSEYPDQQVPVEVSFGTGQRELLFETYSGKAEVNSTSIKVGDQVVILQKDQNCTSTKPNEVLNCDAVKGTRMGSFRIEGKINQGNNFTGVIQSKNVTGMNNKNITATLDGMKFNSKFTYGGDQYIPGGSSNNNGTWNFDFSNPEKNFKL